MNRRRFVRSTLAAAATLSLPFRGWTAITAPASLAADIDAVTGDGGEVTLKRTAVHELAASLRGDLLLPGHDAYDAARRVLNPAIDKYPALIARCRGAADVRHAVQFARSSNLLVAVKCGGHSLSGQSTCDGGLLIDLSPLRHVRVDARARVAWVAGGCLLGDMDHETMAHGLVTTAGTVSHTGVGGLTLGGGFGRLARRLGLAVDNLLAVEIVTSDGVVRRASAEENPDLFWAVRGGGGNFGVVTAFKFRLHPMARQVVGGTLTFPLTQARQVLRFFAEYIAEAPDELYVDAGISSRPGAAGVGFSVCWSGASADAERWLDPLRKAGTPLHDGLTAVDYVALQKSTDVTDPRARGMYVKSGFTTGITHEAIEDVLAGFEEHPERAIGVGFAHVGGAVGRVPVDATAFAHRDARHDLLAILDWPMNVDSAPHVAWLKAYWATLEPHTRGVYVNDASESSRERIHANYQGNLPRLVELKTRYDPTNLFRLNANIQPTG